jgi:GTP-binding protein HflX
MHDIAEIISEDYKEDGIYLKVEISRDDRFLVEDYVLENEEGKN